MKHWQVGTIIALLIGAGLVVIAYPPGSRVVRSERQSRATPLPQPTPADTRVSLLFVGDIMLSRSVGALMLARQDWLWPFTLIASVTREADLTFGNLETTVSTRGALNGCGFCFRADPRAIAGLVHAGFDVLSIANNHTWDYGLTALEDTVTLLASHSIGAVGGGRSLAEARGPVVRSVDGTTIAYLAYTDILPASAQATTTRAGVNLYDAVSMADDIVRARSLADVVVVSFHTGTEYETIHSLHQERIYHAAIDAGADLVVGHHPHVVQDVEQYKGKWIAYSLGNFVFDQNWSLATRKGAILDVMVEGGEIVSVATHSITISTDYQPSLDQ